MVAINVTRGVGVGKIANTSSCTNPPVIDAVFVLDNQPRRFQITDNILSSPIYRAQALAAQYACTKPLLKGKSLAKTCGNWVINGPNDTIIIVKTTAPS